MFFYRGRRKLRQKTQKKSKSNKNNMAGPLVDPVYVGGVRLVRNGF